MLEEVLSFSIFAFVSGRMQINVFASNLGERFCWTVKNFMSRSKKMNRF